MFMNLNSLLVFLDLMVMVLLSVGFMVVLERKVLGYIQIRKGPNKVGVIGLFQPFSDALKLFSKETTMILKSNYLFFLISPMMSMLLMLLLWMNIPVISKLFNFKYSILMVMCLLSMGVYFIMIAGWSSNSMYSLIGSMRSVAQTISYEVSMILIMMFLIFLIESYNMYMYYMNQLVLWFMFLNFPMCLILFSSFLAELNRTPYDLAEGESELVSGFNTEYMSGSFAMIFIAEYGMIMFMMMMFCLMFMGGNIYSMSFYLVYSFMLFLVLWVRGTFPRFRYDNLMSMTWKIYLPVSLSMLIWIIGMINL